MPANYDRARAHVDRMLRSRTLDELSQQLEPRYDDPSPRVPSGCRSTGESLEQRWQLLSGRDKIREQLVDHRTAAQIETYKSNIENFIGCARIPIGLAGPLRVNGLFARGDYYIPLATTEAALVASYSRGAQLISEAGGCAAALLNESVSRAPGFVFGHLRESGLFGAWALSQVEDFRSEAERTSRHVKLVDMRIAVEGNHVYLIFDFTTGDASGQNMVTIATEAICAYINAHSPVRAQYSFVEANLSGDKKASAQSFLSVRGKKVTAEVFVPADLLKKRLRATPERMANGWRLSAVGSVLGGAIGLQGHYANGLAALYLACGQDVACVAESAIGVTRFEVTAKSELYAAVTLPNLMIGTVGGGTELPTQRACLEIMDLAGSGKAQALAEVCAGLCLAGEISIAAALCTGEFARAHRSLARCRAHRGHGNGIYDATRARGEAEGVKRRIDEEGKPCSI